MDYIPFKKVSLEEAKASLQADTRETVPMPPKKNWAPNRMLNHDHSASDLTVDTFKWLATLPKEVRPNALALKYPRIANRIAEIWNRPVQCERYLDDLLMDLRGDRQGFPQDVAANIASLKGHFLKSTKTVHFGVWGNRIGFD